MRLSAAWLETLNKSTMPKGDDLARAVRAAAPIKAMCVVVGMLMITLAGSMIIWGQSPKGPMGDQGPPGPKGPRGDAGPPSTTSGIRIVRSNCDETTCRVQCGENEMLLTAYCGPNRNLSLSETPYSWRTGANRVMLLPDGPTPQIALWRAWTRAQAAAKGDARVTASF